MNNAVEKGNILAGCYYSFQVQAGKDLPDWIMVRYVFPLAIPGYRVSQNQAPQG